MTTFVKIVIGVAATALTGAGIYFGIKDGKAKEELVNKQYAEAMEAINQMKKDTEKKVKEDVKSQYDEFENSIRQARKAGVPEEKILHNAIEIDKFFIE